MGTHYVESLSVGNEGVHVILGDDAESIVGRRQHSVGHARIPELVCQTSSLHGCGHELCSFRKQKHQPWREEGGRW